MTSASDGQTATLKGGSREVIPLKKGQSPVDTIKKVKKGTSPLGDQDNEVRRVWEIYEKPERELYQGEDYELRWDDRGDLLNFGFSTCEPVPCEGDSIAQWMVPLAGAIVKKIFLYVVNFEGGIDLCLYRSNYDGEVTTSDCIDANGWVGLYVDSNGESCDEGDDCTWLPGDNPCFNDPLLGEKIWPPLNIDCFDVEITSDDAFSWVEIDLGAFEYIDIGEEPFFVAGHARRSGGWGFGAHGRPVIPYHSFKYYSGEGTSGNSGWHIRSYGWDLYAIVEYYEDISPFISYLDIGYFPPNLVCALITDENPSGGSKGVAGAWLYWHTDSVMDSVEMVAEGDTFCIEFPELDHSLKLTWWIGAVDVNGNWSYSDQRSYSIWVPQSPILILLDGLLSTGYPGKYYFYDNYGWWNQWWHIPPRDIWGWGHATLDLLDLYDTVIEITTKGPVAGNAVAIKAWLDEGGKNYILAGDEAVGGWFGWPGIPVDIDTVTDEYAFQAVPFFQYLGIETYYGDINYAEEDDQQLPWPISAVEGDVISGALYNAFTNMLPDTAVLLYDPYKEINASNWLDGFEVDETVTIAFTAQPNPDSDYEADTLAIGFYKEDESLNNKVVFFGFDPLSINSEPYIWWGATPYSPLVQSLDWMGVFDLTVSDEIGQVPSNFVLYQNYPNPFNPSTTIEFSIPQSGIVTLTVYDVLGRKVETIVDEPTNAGHHKVQWNASDVSSGIYFVRMESGDFSRVRKVMVLR